MLSKNRENSRALDVFLLKLITILYVIVWKDKFGGETIILFAEIPLTMVTFAAKVFEVYTKHIGRVRDFDPRDRLWVCSFMCSVHTKSRVNRHTMASRMTCEIQSAVDS